MNVVHKCRLAEHRARVLLEAAGFEVCRAAGSKGPADLAWDTTSIRFISVKSGTKYATPSIVQRCSSCYGRRMRRVKSGGFPIGAGRR
jgi:hypothetical protein